MSEQPSKKRPSVKRLGSLQEDTGPSPSGRLGSLRLTTTKDGTATEASGVKPEPSGAGPSSGRGSGGPAGGRPSKPGASKVAFRPNVNQVRRKASKAAVQLRTETEEKEKQSFQQLLEQANMHGREQAKQERLQLAARAARSKAFEAGGPGDAGLRGRKTTPGSKAGPSTAEPSAAGKGAGASAKPEPAAEQPQPEREPAAQAKPRRALPQGDFLDYRQYYPTVLPMIRPGCEHSFSTADNPLPLDLAETQGGIDDLHISKGLGLLGEAPEASEEQLFLVQLPQVLPVLAQPEKQESTAAASPAMVPAALEVLPSGRLGKLLVFESGRVRLQIGDILFDVLGGSPLMHAMDASLILTSPEDKSLQRFSLLGAVAQRMVVVPNIDQLLEDQPVPDFKSVDEPASTAGDTAAAATGAETDVAADEKPDTVDLMDVDDDD